MSAAPAGTVEMSKSGAASSGVSNGISATAMPSLLAAARRPAARCVSRTATVTSRVPRPRTAARAEEHTSELQSLAYLVCRLLLEKKKKAEREPNHPSSTKVLHPELATYRTR